MATVMDKAINLLSFVVADVFVETFEDSRSHNWGLLLEIICIFHYG